MKAGKTRFLHPPPRRTDHLSPNIDRELLKHEASLRREALVANGLHTYMMGYKGSSITCLCCGLTSRNSEDVNWRYCAFCDVSHDDVLEVKA